MLKTTTLEHAAQLNDSKIYGKGDMCPTDIPIVNIALSGEIDGGLTPGILTIAGPSKHFKTLFSLLLAKAYLDKHPDGVILFYDSEFGSNVAYLEMFGIPEDKVIHCPIVDIEQLKHDIMTQLGEIKKGDHVFILIDSLGNLASKKEVEDSIEGKSVADMTRAKAMKSLGRMITPHLTIKDIPLVAVNHTYKEIGLYPKDIVSGGCVGLGTKIIMFDGSLKNIEDIRPGEKVKTLYGDKIVTYTWNPETLIEGNPECFEIEFESGLKIVCSENHLFLKNDDWTEVNHLSVGDVVKNIFE